MVYVTYPSICCHLGKLESSNCVAHLAVDSVHTKVAVGRIRLPMLKGWSVSVTGDYDGQGTHRGREKVGDKIP